MCNYLHFLDSSTEEMKSHEDKKALIGLKHSGPEIQLSGTRLFTQPEIKIVCCGVKLNPQGWEIGKIELEDEAVFTWPQLIWNSCKYCRKWN